MAKALRMCCRYPKPCVCASTLRLLKMMRKPQVVAEIMERAGLNKTQAEAALVAFTETVVDCVSGRFTAICYVGAPKPLQIQQVYEPTQT